MAGAWLGAMRNVPGVAVVGLVDIRRESAERRRDEFGLSRAETGTDLRAMLKATKPDAVFDVTVPEAHCGVVLESMKHGCHVLGEKPMADTMENARRMVAASKRAGKLYAVIQNRRYLPTIEAYRRFIAGGKLGPLTTLDVDFYVGAHFGGFRAQMKHVLLLDMAIHTIDAIRFISGVEPRSVIAADWNPEGSWYRHGASASAVFEMSRGVVANYRGSWCSEGMHTSWEGSWRAVCGKGTVTWDGGEGFVSRKAVSGKGLVWRDEAVAAPAVKPMRAQGHEALIREFVHCVRGGGVPQTVCTDNIRSLAMVHAAIESAETGSRVRVRA